MSGFVVPAMIEPTYVLNFSFINASYCSSVIPSKYFCGVVENSNAIDAFATVLTYPSINRLTGSLILDLPNGLSLVAFQTSGSINGLPIICGNFSAFHSLESEILVSSQISVSVYKFTCEGLYVWSLLSIFVSIIASPQSILPFSPFQIAEAVNGE